MPGRRGESGISRRTARTCPGDSMLHPRRVEGGAEAGVEVEARTEAGTEAGGRGRRMELARLDVEVKLQIQAGRRRTWRGGGVGVPGCEQMQGQRSISRRAKDAPA